MPGKRWFPLLVIAALFTLAIPLAANPPRLSADGGDDRAALAALYNATGGPNWTNDTNWLSNAPIGEWRGVTTDAGGLVTELSLNNNQLSGAIPPQLGNLASLTRLSLYDNQLSGAIPPELGNLANLRWLYLANNQLSGAIPPELGNLANLRWLYLANNQLSGAIPPELGNLANLTELYLRNNQLSGEIPPELGNLANLTGLSLANNQLSGAIPAELGDLDSLTHIYLSANSLTGCVPAGLRDVANNDFTELGLPFCGDAPALNPDLVVQTPSVSDSSPDAGASFTLSATVHNQGNGPSASTTLRYYRSTDSTITSSDTQVGTDPVGGLAASGSSPGSVSLTAPSSAGTYYYGACVAAVACESDTGNNCSEAVSVTVASSLPPSTQGDRAALAALYNATGGRNWTNDTNWRSNAPIGEWRGVTTDASGRVTGLSLYYNQLSGAIPPELSNLTNLTRLHLYNNQLSGGIPPQLGNLASLTRLWLDGNQLSGAIPPQLGNLASLTGLSLRNNQLSGEIPPKLGNLASLTGLSLSNNQLSGAIPPELGNLANLTELYLRNNQLSGEIPPQLGNLANLTTLSLRNNQLSGAIPPELGNLANLEDLYLYNNQLTGAIPPQLGDLDNLTYIYLSGNSLTGCVPAGLRDVANNDFTELGLPFCGDAPALNPDLVVQTPSVSDSSPDAGASFTLSATVHNQGNGPSASTTLRYYRSTDSTITSSDTQVGTDPVGGLAASGSSPGSVSLTAPSSAGTYYYGACVAAVAGESDTGNNCSEAVSVTVASSLPPSTQGDRAALAALYNATGGPNWTDNTNWLSNAPIGEWRGVTTGANGRVTGLSLSNNQLSGEIPPELGDLDNLTHIYLSGNSLTGCVPAGLRDVPTNDFDALGLLFCADTLVARYDGNGNGKEDLNEVIAAINDYLDGVEGITIPDVIRLINLYLDG